jgi:hypothetical protein
MEDRSGDQAGRLIAGNTRTLNHNRNIRCPCNIGCFAYANQLGNYRDNVVLVIMRRASMSTTYNRLLPYFASIFFIMITLACAIIPSAGVEPNFTATEPAPPRISPSATSTPTETATLSPAQLKLTEFASQAEGTRQVLVETEVALLQSIDATATARSLDATASILAPLPSVNEEVEVQANIMWQDTGIEVRLGNTVNIEYISGEWTIWIDTDPLTDGMGQYGRDETCRLLPESNLGGLIGRVGDNPPFFIGNGTEYYSNHNGTLQLSINDCPEFGSNSGSLTVSVVIER